MIMERSKSTHPVREGLERRQIRDDVSQDDGIPRHTSTQSCDSGYGGYVLDYPRRDFPSCISDESRTKVASTGAAYAQSSPPPAGMKLSAQELLLQISSARDIAVKSPRELVLGSWQFQNQDDDSNTRDPLHTRERMNDCEHDMSSTRTTTTESGTSKSPKSSTTSTSITFGDVHEASVSATKRSSEANDEDEESSRKKPNDNQDDFVPKWLQKVAYPTQMPCPMLELHDCQGTNTTISELLRSLVNRHRILICKECCSRIPIQDDGQRPADILQKHEVDGCERSCIGTSCSSGAKISASIHRRTENCPSWAALTKEVRWTFIWTLVNPGSLPPDPEFLPGPAFEHGQKRRPCKQNKRAWGNDICAQLIQDIEAKEKRISTLEQDLAVAKTDHQRVTVSWADCLTTLEKESQTTKKEIELVEERCHEKVVNLENIIENLSERLNEKGHIIPRSLQKRLHNEFPTVMAGISATSFATNLQANPQSLPASYSPFSHAHYPWVASSTSAATFPAPLPLTAPILPENQFEMQPDRYAAPLGSARMNNSISASCADSTKEDRSSKPRSNLYPRNIRATRRLMSPCSDHAQGGGYSDDRPSHVYYHTSHPELIARLIGYIDAKRTELLNAYAFARTIEAGGVPTMKRSTQSGETSRESKRWFSVRPLFFDLIEDQTWIALGNDRGYIHEGFRPLNRPLSPTIPDGIMEWASMSIDADNVSSTCNDTQDGVTSTDSSPAASIPEPTPGEAQQSSTRTLISELLQQLQEDEHTSDQYGYSELDSCTEYRDEEIYSPQMYTDGSGSSRSSKGSKASSSLSLGGASQSTQNTLTPNNRGDDCREEDGDSSRKRRRGRQCPRETDGVSPQSRDLQMQCPFLHIDGCRGTNPTISELLRDLACHHRVVICDKCCSRLDVPKDEEKAITVLKSHQDKSCERRCINDTCSGSDDAPSHAAKPGCLAWRALPNRDKWSFIWSLIRPDLTPPSMDLVPGPGYLHNSEIMPRRKQPRTRPPVEILREVDKDVVLQENRIAILEQELNMAKTKAKNLENIIQDLLERSLEKGVHIPNSLQLRLEYECSIVVPAPRLSTQALPTKVCTPDSKRTEPGSAPQNAHSTLSELPLSYSFDERNTRQDSTDNSAQHNLCSNVNEYSILQQNGRATTGCGGFLCACDPVCSIPALCSTGYSLDINEDDGLGDVGNFFPH